MFKISTLLASLTKTVAKSVDHHWAGSAPRCPHPIGPSSARTRLQNGIRQPFDGPLSVTWFGARPDRNRWAYDL